MKKSILLLLVFISAFSLFMDDANAISNNRLFTRLFHQHPTFHNSPTRVKIDGQFTRAIEVLNLEDKRDNFIGETVTGGIKVEKYNDFWDASLSDIIITKMKNDFRSFGMNTNNSEAGLGKLVIKPTLEVFYPCVTGFIWEKCEAKVRIGFLVTINDKVVLDKIYEEVYITSGTDEGYEGSIFDTIENCANISIGMCLGMTLDKFYLDLKSVMA